MDSGICYNCIDDHHLSDEVFQDGVVVVCTECENKDVGITFKTLGERLEPLLRQYYVPGEEYKRFSGEDDDNGYTAQYGDSLSDIVQEQLGNCYTAH